MNNDSKIWWLNPAWVFCGFTTLITIAAVAIPDDLYRFLWGMPKYMYFDATCTIMASVVAFGLAAMLPSLKPAGWVKRTTQSTEPALNADTLMLLYKISFWLCMIGYAVWGALALKRGLNLHVIAGLLSGGRGASDGIRETYLGNITGVTTATQFGIASSALGALIIAQRGLRSIWVSQVFLFGTAVLRAMLNSERLAVIELAVPMAVTIMHYVILPRSAGRRWLRQAITFFPLGASTALYFIFGFFEYFRSWLSYYSTSGYSFWVFTGSRLAGYYVTALNNGAFFLDRLNAPLNMPYFVFNFLWRFPLLSDITTLVFGKPFEADEYFEMLYRGANPEFNNADGLLVPMFDFGLAGGLIYWLAAGLACGYLYRAFRSGNAWGLCLYPFAYIGIIDVTRGIYWASGRSIPPLAFLLLSAFILRIRQKRQQAVSPVISAEPLDSFRAELPAPVDQTGNLAYSLSSER